MKELKDLQVGDEVVIKGLGYPERIAKIERITKTQIVVNGYKFNRGSGSQCGNNGWEGKNIYVLTDELKEQLQEVQRKRNIISYIEKFNFNSLSVEELLQVYNIIKSN